ncbi:MAG: hypothetical protein WEF50_21825 [Myxococcota bacterium]
MRADDDPLVRVGSEQRGHVPVRFAVRLEGLERGDATGSLELRADPLRGAIDARACRNASRPLERVLHRPRRFQEQTLRPIGLC